MDIGIQSDMGKQTLSKAESEPLRQLWTLPPPNWILAPGEIHVWSAALDQPGSVATTLADTLSEDEKLRAAQYKFERERERWKISRGLLRQILGCYLRCEPTQVGFRYGRKGKPALALGENVHALNFNFSHSGNLALCAVTLQAAVGVDVERISLMAEANEIARQFFFPEEQVELYCASDIERERTFFKIWTRKEAVLKWSGRGITEIENTATNQEFDGYCEELAPAQGYIGCIAARKKPAALRLWQWATG